MEAGVVREENGEAKDIGKFQPVSRVLPLPLLFVEFHLYCSRNSSRHLLEATLS